MFRISLTFIDIENENENMKMQKSEENFYIKSNMPSANGRNFKMNNVWRLC